MAGPCGRTGHGTSKTHMEAMVQPSKTPAPPGGHATTKRNKTKPGSRGAVPSNSQSPKQSGETGGPKGLEPTRYGDWERGGRCIDF